MCIFPDSYGLLKIFIYLFLDRGEGMEKDRERNITVGCLSCDPQWGRGLNPGMCPDWELNQWPFSSQASVNPLSHISKGSKGFNI